MFTLTHEFHFACTPEVLFTALTDVQRKKSWDTELIEERVEPGLQVGAHVHQQRRFMGRVISSVSVITGWMPGEGFTSQSLPGEAVLVSGSYRIQATADGAVLHHSFTMQGMPRFIEPLARLGLDRSLRGRFARLARLLERGESLQAA